MRCGVWKVERKYRFGKLQCALCKSKLVTGLRHRKARSRARIEPQVVDKWIAELQKPGLRRILLALQAQAQPDHFFGIAELGWPHQRHKAGRDVGLLQGLDRKRTRSVFQNGEVGSCGFVLQLRGRQHGGGAAQMAQCGKGKNKMDEVSRHASAIQPASASPTRLSLWRRFYAHLDRRELLSARRSDATVLAAETGPPQKCRALWRGARRRCRAAPAHAAHRHGRRSGRPVARACQTTGSKSARL